MQKKVLITGGSKGIGFETVKMFLEKGEDVYVVSRTKGDLDSSNVTFIEADLSDENFYAPGVLGEVGDIDILINNAGVMNSLPFDQYPEDKQKMLMNLNLYTPVKLINFFAEGMIRRGGGRIVNVASIAGEIGHPDIWYGVSKAGIINITKSYSKLLGPKGVVINAVAPGPVNTDMLSVIDETRVEVLKGQTLLGRVANPEDVARAIYWLSTDSPEYINGTCIDVNNGAYMR